MFDLQCDKDLQITAVHGVLHQVFSNLLASSLNVIGPQEQSDAKDIALRKPADSKRWLDALLSCKATATRR